MASEAREKFQATFRRADELVQQGQGGQLIKVDFPFPTHMVAEAYVDKYGPADRYNWLRYANQIDVPALLTFGEKEILENAAFQGIESDISEMSLPKELWDIRKIPGADHFYSGRQAELLEVICGWIHNRT